MMLSLRHPTHNTMRSDPRTGIFTTSDGCDIAFTLHPAETDDSPRPVLIHPLGLDGTIWNEVARQLNGRAELLT